MDTDLKGFILEFNGEEFSDDFGRYIYTSYFDDRSYDIGYYNSNMEYWNSGVSVSFSFYMDDDTYDFGFVNAGSYSKFSINSYSGPVLYIDKIEIDWAKGINSGGSLNLLGSRSSTSSPYEHGFLTDAQFKNADNDLDQIISPSALGVDVTDIYEFEKPLRYLAFIYDIPNTRANNNVARFRGFRIHFLYEDPSDFPTGLKDTVVKDEEETYYDLTGKRINKTNLKKGVYIKMTNGKTEKIYSK